MLLNEASAEWLQVFCWNRFCPFFPRNYLNYKWLDARRRPTCLSILYVGFVVRDTKRSNQTMALCESKTHKYTIFNIVRKLRLRLIRSGRRSRGACHIVWALKLCLNTGFMYW